MKRLPPAIQEKQRYLRFRVRSKEDVEIGDVVNAVWNASLSYLGSKDSSQADFWVIGNRFDEEKQEGVIRVNHGSEDELRAAITMIEEIGGEKGFIEILEVSGTMKSLED